MIIRSAQRTLHIARADLQPPQKSIDRENSRSLLERLQNRRFEYVRGDSKRVRKFGARQIIIKPTCNETTKLARAHPQRISAFYIKES